MGFMLVGVDDTDFGESIGTGALARELRLYLERTSDVRVRGITRHQLLVHPDVPYTSHNSAACLAVETGQSAPGVTEQAQRFVRYLFHEGADPGLCVAIPGQLTRACLDFGLRAQKEVLTTEEALRLAGEARVTLLDLGGTGQGVIGALAGCALRAGGNDGRFISLPGIRDMAGTVTAAEIVACTGIDEVVGSGGEELPGDALVRTDGWVRPDWRGHRVVLNVAAFDGHYRVVGKKAKDKSFEQ